MEDYKKLLTDLYTTHDPERIKQIDYFLEKYKGKEKQFYISQQTKYKKKKPISDSKKIIEEALARIKSQSADKTKAKTEKEEKPKEKAAAPTKAVEEKKPAPIPIPIPIPKKEEVKEPIKESKKEAEKIKDDKPISKEIKASPPQKSKPRKNDNNFNKKYFLYIFGSVLLVIIIAVIIFFFFFYNPSTKKTEAPVEKTKTTITKKTAPAESKKAATTTAKPATENKKTVQKTVKATAKSTPEKQSTASLSNVHIKKGDISLPAYFVACSAVKNESFALIKVNELRAQGFNASYYWIPDFVTYGTPYFKVVIGPFSTRMDAMRKLTPVQERAEFDAYVLELK